MADVAAPAPDMFPLCSVMESDGGASCKLPEVVLHRAGKIGENGTGFRL
jgi:hypothetical protein